jgi:hypothetical protein
LLQGDHLTGVLEFDELRERHGHACLGERAGRVVADADLPLLAVDGQPPAVGPAHDDRAGVARVRR